MTFDYEKVQAQDRDESAVARVERAQLAIGRVLVLIAAAQEALVRAGSEVTEFETAESDGRLVYPDDAKATDLIGSTIDEMVCVSHAVLRMAKHGVDQAFDAIIHNSGRMQYWLSSLNDQQRLT